MRIITTLLSLLWLVTGIAQVPSEEFEALKAKHPKAEYVNIKLDYHVTVELKKDSLVVTRTDYEEGIVLGQNGRYFNQRSAHSSRFRELADLEAYSLIPNGKKYRKEKVTEFAVSDFVNGGIFKDDSKETSFEFPKVEEGVKTVHITKHHVHDAHLMPLLALPLYAPIEEATFRVEHDKSVNLKLNTFQMDETPVEYAREESGSTVTHTWKFKNLEKMEMEGDAQASLYYIPQVALQVQSYEGSSGKVRVLEDLDDLHNWYCAFLQKTDNEDPEIITLADSLAGDSEDTLEVVKRMYQWVQSNIKYVAFEEGYKGYIPENADAVCTNRYGDCKGMSNLLNTMLQSQGIRSNVAWVGTRDLPYSYNELPTPNVDNHMIAVVQQGSDVFFMDPTHSNLPFGMPSPFIQQKEVLINQNCAGYQIMKAPLTEASRNLLRDSVELEIEGQDLLGQGVAELHGYVRMSFFDYQQEQGYDYLKRYCRGYLLKGSNKFVLDTVWLENKDNTNLPLILHYKFHIQDYLTTVGSENYLNLNLEMVSAPTRIEKKRKLPLEVRHTLEEEYTFILNVDKGHSVSFLPENASHDSEKFRFDQRYAQRDQQVKRNAKYVRDFILLETDDFKPWNDYVNAVNGSFRHRLVLDKQSP